jgi:hypothetical protein
MAEGLNTRRHAEILSFSSFFIVKIAVYYSPGKLPEPSLSKCSSD